MKKDFKKLLQKLRQAGWVVSVTGGNHYRLESPTGGVPVFCSKTPSDRWALKNLCAYLRKREVDPSILV